MFVYPWLMMLLVVIPLLGALWFWMARQGRRNLSRLVSPALQPRLMPPHSSLRFDLQLALALTGLLLLLLAAARPQWGSREERVSSRSRNLVIAVDVSRSMLARDVHPNRLERSKVDIMDLIGELKGDRAALLAFRRRGVLLCPLTTDYAFLRQALDGLSTDSAPRGETDLADAIRKALEALTPAQDDYNAILLISDGEDLAGGALAAAQEARQRGVPIFTVGIGDASGASVPDENGALTYRGEKVQSRLTEETLTAIARESGGRYVPLGTASTVQTTLGSIFRQHLRQITAREQQERMARRRIERYQWFLIPAIGLLLVTAALSRGRLSASRQAIQRHPPRTAATPPPLRATAPLSLLLALWLGTGSAYAASNNGPETAPPATATPAVSADLTNAVGAAAGGRAAARQAQTLFRRSRYIESADAYEAAARNADTEESQTYLFNAALARHAAHREQEAMELLEPLVHTTRAGDRATELLGLAAFQLAAATNGPEAAAAKVEALETAGSAFQQALRNQPQDARRQRNLSRVSQQLPALREEARIVRLLKQHGQTPPDQLVTTMLREQRALLQEIPAAFTNEAPAQIRLLEALAERQERACDLWVPLKQAVLQSPTLTNVEQRAQFERLVETTRDSMTACAAQLRDLNPEVCSSLPRTEPPVYLFWRSLVGPPTLLDEDIALQSNAIVRAATPIVPYRPDQPEALALTRAFQQRFPAWAAQVVQAAQADTNAPTLTPADQAEIERLTAETIPLQQEPSPPQQELSLRNLLRIRELLPKQKQSPDSQSQPQPQQQPQQQQQQQPQPSPPKQEEKQEQQPKEEPREQPPKNVQDLLQRALQREKEHEAEKRRQMEKLPMLPNERDW
jgi:Ca-activated chloride channel family protein